MCHFNGLVAISLVMLVGCSAAPPFSIARYARSSGESGRVTAAAGFAYVRDTEDDGSPTTPEDIVQFPVAEGGGSVWVHDLYGVHATVTPGVLSLEGQLRLGSPELGFGIVHGVGFGVSSSTETTWMLQLGGGGVLEAQLAPNHHLLVAARYVFSDNFPSESMPMVPAQRAIHWIGGGVGWLGRLAPQFELSIEIIAGAAVPEADGASALFFLTPTVTVNGIID